MAGNIAGMFAQINKAVQGNPLAAGNSQGDGGGLLGMASQGFGNAAAAGMNAINGPEGYQSQGMDFMSEPAIQMQGQRELRDADLTTVEGMREASKIYASMGDAAKAAALAKAASDKEAEEAEKARKKQYVISTADKAEKLGLTEDAKMLRAGGHTDKDLEDISKKIREEQLIQLAAVKNGPARKGLAKSMGISEAEYKEAGLAQASPENFTAYVQGREAKPEGYTDATGKPVILSTNTKTGKILDPADGVWKHAHEMGLTPSVSVSKVHNISNEIVQGLGMKGVDKFDALHTAANDAQVTMDNINRNLPLIDSMPTGTLAEMRLWMSTALDTLGIEQPEAANAQVYLADAGQRVAKEIKAFGAGTGLSDKDREFAENMAAGKISITGEALKRILNIRKKVAQGTIDNFNTTKEKIMSTSDDPNIGTVMEMFQLTPSTGGPVQLSPQAEAFFK